MALKRDPYTEPKERERMGGSRREAGPGDEGLPGARDMDRPSGDQRAWVRTGERTQSMTRGIRTIQDQEEDRGRP